MYIKQSYYTVISQFIISLTNFSVSLQMMRQGDDAGFGVFAFLLSFFFVINAINASFCISYINNVCADVDSFVFFSRLKHLLGKFYPLLVSQLVLASVIWLADTELFGITSDQIAATMATSCIWIIYESIRRIYIHLAKAQVMVFFDLAWASVVIVNISLFYISAVSYFLIYSVVACCSILLLSLVLIDKLKANGKVLANTRMFWEFGITGSSLQLLGLLSVQSIQLVILSKGGGELLAAYEGPRILIMPVITLTLGLMNYYHPRLRIAYVEGGVVQFLNGLKKALIQGVSLSILYLSFLTLAYQQGLIEIILNDFKLIPMVMYAWVAIVLLIMVQIFMSVLFAIVHKPRLILISYSLSAITVLALLYSFYQVLNVEQVVLVRLAGEVVQLAVIIYLFINIRRKDTGAS